MLFTAVGIGYFSSVDLQSFVIFIYKSYFNNKNRLLQVRSKRFLIKGVQKNVVFGVQ